MQSAATLMGLLTAIVGLGSGYIRGKFVGNDESIPLPAALAGQIALQQRLYYVFFGLAAAGLTACVAILLAFNVLAIDPAWAIWAAAGTGALLLATSVLAAATYAGIPK